MKASEQTQEEDADKPELGDFEVDPRCEGSDPFKPLQLRHSSDCTKFYKCYMGKAYVIRCPRGQHWGQHLNRCEHPSLAHCTVARPVIQPAQAELEESSEESMEEYTIVDHPDYKIRDARCIPNEEDIYHPIQFAHPTDCSYFYKCFDHKGFKNQCPGGLHYNAEAGYCDYPKYAKCKLTGFAAAQAEELIEDEDDSAEDEPEPTIVDDIDYKIEDNRCAPDEDDIYHPIQFAHPTDCQYFYKCYLHFAYKAQCPFGLHFNEEEQYCDYPAFANCKAVAASAVQASAPAIPSCPQDENVNMAVDGVYDKYFSCQEGLAYLMECENGKLFNPMATECQIPPSQHPGQMNQQYPQNQPMPQYQGQYPGGQMNQFASMMTPEMMHQLQEMFSHYPQMMSQFPGMMNPGMMNPGMMNPGQMNPGQIVQTPMRPQTPNVQAPEAPQAPHQPNPDFPSWMPVPNQNVVVPEMPTLSEKPSHQKPSDEKNFNYQDGKPNSRCPSLDQPMKPTHLSHETECKKFYKCFNGRAFLMECPEAQEWSNELARCDYHQFAGCDPVELIKQKIQN